MHGTKEKLILYTKYVIPSLLMTILAFWGVIGFFVINAYNDIQNGKKADTAQTVLLTSIDAKVNGIKDKDKEQDSAIKDIYDKLYMRKSLAQNFNTDGN